MLRFSILWTMLLTIFSTSAFAQGQTSLTVNSSILKENKNQTFKENTDITDAKLKADAGSLSRYSLKFNLSYAGPTLSDLSAKDQPNPDGTVGSFQTALSGTMGARYRINSKSSVGIATGLKAIHPFHEMERFDLSNPSLSFDYSARVRDVQMKNAPGFVYRTIPEFKKVAQWGMIYDNHSMVYSLGTSGFSIGTDMAVGYFLYEREYQIKDKKSARYSLEFNPNLKYNFSDRLSFVTSTNMSWWNPRARGDQFSLINKTLNQRMGLGFSVKRDIYLNPFLTFYPQHLAWSGVTLNISTIFSVF